MKLALIPPHALDAPAVAATIAYSPDRAWIIGEQDHAVEQFSASVTEVRVNTEHPVHLAELLAPDLSDFAEIYMPMCSTGRELGAALSKVLDRPVCGPVLHRNEQRTTLILNDQCVQQATPPRAIFLIAAQPAPPNRVDIRDRVDRSLEWPALGSADTVRTTAVHAPDPGMIDLSEADRIVTAGIGCGRAEVVEDLGSVGRAMGASLGATRVITDAGWLPFERQIGTTGALVSPSLYLAFGVSGAVQHLTGIGRPEHVIAVNTDLGAPMMKFADLAIVADAPATIQELKKRLIPAEHEERFPARGAVE